MIQKPHQVIDLNIHLDPSVEKLLLDYRKDLHAAIIKTGKEILMAIADVSASLDAYAAKVDAYVAAQEAKQQTIDQIVAAAIAADDAGEEVDLQAIKVKIDEAAARVPDAPVAPTV